MSGTLSVSDLAKVLFVSTLQASENPSPDQVRTAIEDRLSTCGGDCTACAVHVAQEAGDHPETYVIRMRWALDAVAEAYPTLLTTRPAPAPAAA
ncbi:MAG TPA: hypothetical protein VFU43_03800 [Streptosporangiaceae bacterium]|nr:hypothetical protein [Streptosporangiaceae bacterium]